MFLRKVRRIGRVFAIALLAWTAVDLLDHRVCVNHAALPELASPAASVLLTAPGGGHAPGHGHHGPPDGHAGDCFCCSAFVDVKTPFQLSVTSTGVWLDAAISTTYQSATPTHLYRPPIAA